MNAQTFPFAALRGGSATVPDRLDQLAARLASTLARCIPEVALTIALVPLPPAGDRVAVAMQRSDGLGAAIDVAPQLAEALVNHALGGSFAAEAVRGETLTASERHAQRQLVAACLEALDLVWPVTGAQWQSANTPVTGTGHGFAVRAPGFDALIGIEIARSDAPNTDTSAPSGRAEAAWSRGLRALIGATGLPLRAVLHERQLPLDQAVRLKPGDVLPIETPREVQLRIGTHRVARGTIAPLGDDGALLVTITSRRPDPATLASPEEPS